MKWKFWKKEELKESKLEEENKEYLKLIKNKLPNCPNVDLYLLETYPSSNQDIIILTSQKLGNIV